MRGLYAAASGMIAQQRKHDAATNNIANVNTPGYKAVNTVMRTFPEALIRAIRTGENGRSAPIGRLATGVFAEEYLPLFVQGDVTATGRATDLALVSNIRVDGLAFDAAGRAVTADGETVWQPQAFFAVANADGEVRFTRDGRFAVNEAGEWVTGSGLRLLGVNGQPIRTAIDPADIQITATGLMLDRNTGEPLVGDDGANLQILISVVEQPYSLIREGNGVFYLDNPAGVRPLAADEGAEVKQGYTEKSNVDPLQATVDMMTALRMYEANQQVIQMYDRILERTVNDIGKLF
jgi:flagellar basal-body rod protein FlgG